MNLVRRLAWLGLAWLVCITLLLGLASPVSAQKSEDTLRISWRDAVADLDPYYNQIRTGLVIAFHVFDTLLYRDPDTLQLKPALAASWRQVDDTTLDFTLRQGVVFHDGSRFSADDVVYTINSVVHDSRIAVPSNYAYLDRAEKIDDTHVRLKLKHTFPASLEYLAMVTPILPKAYRERVGADAFNKMPVGTGPYRITKVEGLDRIFLERFDSYFATSPKGKPAIRKLVINEVRDSSEELADLINGRADWIWDIEPEKFDIVVNWPNLQAVRAETMRVPYVSMDAAGRTGAGNPLTVEKVRQAILYAVDRQAMARQLVPGGSRVLDAPCYPSQFGCDQASAVKYAYDPAKAKQLLAEAGYPDGFDTDLVSYLLPTWTDAVQSYLKAVGIKVRLAQLPVGRAVALSEAGQNPLDMGSWGSYSINDVSAFLPVFFAGGPRDYVRDPELEALIRKGDTSTSPDQRRKYYSAAIRLITQRADFMPLFTYIKSYGFSRQLNFKPYPDEIARFYLSSWK